MERAWKVTNLFIGLVLIGLCSGFPIGLENSAADYHTQFLTGLVGVLLTICGVVFLAGCLCCQRKNGFKEFHNNPVVASSTSSLDHGHINPIANGEFTIFTPLSPPVQNNNVFLANEQIVGQTEIDYNHAEFDVRSWFDGTETDFPRTRLKYIKELGKGWFGRVVEGTAQILNDGDEKQNWTPVAVRILEASATSSERAVFLHDAVIYRCGKHPHILQLLGRSLESVPLLLLQEICPRGDLKKYLRDNRVTAEKLLSSDLPLLWCCQLSSAIKHLHDHRLTHPDLAARNCQVVSDLSLKLGDYGLAASSYPEDYYQGAPAVPVRWCAPESLTYTSTTIQPKQITFESNVWSLGVTMWEIYECGAQPYANFTDDDVLSQVLGSSNVRLSKPECSILYTDYIFRLMQLCWSTSESRPSVSQVHLMLTDLMQVYQNTKHITHSEPPISLQEFDKRWDTFKPNSVAKRDNHEFAQESVSMADIDLSDITILNMNLSKDEELLYTKPMSPSLNNLHGSLDNLASGEMDSWLQKVATKTGDMSYVRGLSEAIKDLDNALALENFSSSDSSHQPSPAPENVPTPKNKLEFKLGPTFTDSNDSNKTQNSSITESMQRTSSESETEDENWRRKIERGAYSEKVHQKSKSVTDLMVLTHIDYSESDSETPLPSLDYRVNYKNVRYAPKQNLENVSLMFGSEGNLLSVHDKFQEELKRLQEERKDSLLFVPESISHNDEKPNKQIKNRISENSSSDEESWTVGKSKDVTCTYVNINPSTRDHRNPESLIEELSSPSDIQPGNQVYNIFNVTVDASFSPMHLKSDLKEIICFKDPESNSNIENHPVEEVVNKNISNECTIQSFQVPKLTELIQNNDDLMNYIITRYESQEDVNINTDVNINISENKDITLGKELNNNIQNSSIQDLPSSSKSTENVQTVTQNFLQNEQQNYELPKVNFDISQTQEEVSPSSMTHSSLFTSTPFTKRNFKNVDGSDENKGEALQFSSNFAGLEQDEEEAKSELKYSLETWDNFLGKALEDGSRECSGFENFSSEPQSLLFVDDSNVDTTVECKNQALIESFNLKNENDLDVNIDLEQNVNKEEESKETEACYVLHNDLKDDDRPNINEISENANKTFVVEENINKTFVCEDKKVEKQVVEGNDLTVVLSDKDEQLDATYTKEHEGGSNWEPGEGWFLHPQTNSEVSGQMEVAQGGEESYVGFSMDDEIMAAIRNELLMKLPQAQGQSSEQVKDTDEWDTEGRSEVLIKYNVYTTPLSPIPEESYSENDSYHLIYNREDSSDSENEDWPEPYEEHNSGLPDTETQSMQNAESPIPEPQNRHTPSQDSCCSNDTLFNLEELTFVVNENETLKLHDLTDKKGCDLSESNKKGAVLDKDTEENTLKVENNKVIEEKYVKEVNKIFLETEIQKLEELENVCKTKNALRSTNKFKAEIFTCNIEPTQSETFSKIEDGEEVLEKIKEDQKDESKSNGIIDLAFKENVNGEDMLIITKNNQQFGEDKKKEEEIELVNQESPSYIVPDGEGKIENTNEEQEKNFCRENDKINLHSTENIQNCLVVSENELNLEISPEKNDLEEIQKENRSYIDDTLNIADENNDTDLKIDAKTYNVDISEGESIFNDVGDKNNTHVEIGVKNEANTSLENNVSLEKSVAITSCDVIKSSSNNDCDLETSKNLESVSITIQDKPCQNTDELQNCEDCEQTHEDEIISHETETSLGNIEDAKNEENIKEGKVINENEVSVSQTEVLTNHNEINIKENADIASKSRVIITLDSFNNMEQENAEDVLKSREVNVNQDKIMSPQDTSNHGKSEIEIENNKNIAEEGKSEISISQSQNIRKYEVTSEINEEPQQNEASFEKIQASTMQNEINTKENEVEGEKLEHQCSETIEEQQNDLKNDFKIENSSVCIKQGEVNTEENLTSRESLENIKEIAHDDGNKIVDIEGGSKVYDKNNKFGNISEEKVSVHQNGFLSDTAEIDLENINLGFIRNEADHTKIDSIMLEKNEGNCSELNKATNIEDIDLERNDVSINKLNRKNMQNGILPENSIAWINENHLDVINVSDNNLSTENGPYQTQPEINKPNEKMCDSTDISLIVENNPNYITEFLNHERQSTIASSSTDNDLNISLQNTKHVNTQITADNDYVNIDDISIKISEHNEPSTDSASYVNTNELGNVTTDLISQPEYVNIVQHDDTEEHLYDPVANEDGDDIYDALSDIRFTGPTDVQLMSTSFSESAEIDEQDWDSGSDTRSSSSGEFIWKEGEHEESVKALRAAPQDVIANEKLTPMEDIEEVSTESSEDEDGDSPEFVPSAWDKYATPTKSALRSPEKTLEKSEVQDKKSKGVWFKKQKYHCVYEYPREPESPNVNSYELWQPVSTSLIDWEVDTNPYGPMFDGTNPHPECYQQLDSHGKNLYQLPDFSSGMTALDDEFFISSTARPFESFGGLSSQFFPGQTSSDQWMDLSKQPIENITPDSGVEDITPSNVDGNEFLQAPPKHHVQPLKLLATVVLKNNQISELKSNSKDALGGLRHARNKLKLDLPPSPSAFTSTKAFTIEPPEEPVTKREVPTFTTFGKSRFLVQHVDTPTCDEENEIKNVSFEALPYKPAQVNNKEDKTKIEVVRGEASLLDSADEDSGIESSTLERKKITNIAD